MRGKRIIGLLLLAGVGCGGKAEPGGNEPPSVTAVPPPRLYVTNFDASNVSAFDLDSHTGALTPLSGAPFPAPQGALQVAISPSLDTLYVSDYAELGVATFSIDGASGALTRRDVVGANTSNANAGVLAVHPNGKFLYAGSCGVDVPGALSVLSLDGDAGAPSRISASLPTPFCPNGIVIEPRGRFLYVSSQYANQGDLEGFAIDPASGALTPLEGSPFGSFLAVAATIDRSHTHVYVCDQDSFVRTFGIDSSTGALNALGKPTPTNANPFSIVIGRADDHLFVANWSGGSISSYALDPLTGMPTEVPGSPFATGSNPDVIAVDATNHFLYTGNQTTTQLHAFAIGAAGDLTEAAGSPFVSGTTPVAGVALP